MYAMQAFVFATATAGIAVAETSIVEHIDVILGLTAYDVSADGLVVVGATDRHTCFGRGGSAAKWTAGDGLQLLDSGTGAGVARAVNADGTVIVGTSAADGPGCCDDDFRVATAWTGSGRSFTPLASSFYDVDNSGTLGVANEFYAEAWDQNTFRQPTGFLTIGANGAVSKGNVFESSNFLRTHQGLEISGDGSVAIGSITFESFSGLQNGFRRYGASGTVLGTGYEYWGGGIECEYGGRMSDDGSVVVLDGAVPIGATDSPAPRSVIFRDGFVPSEFQNSAGWVLTAVSGDGRVIGGRLNGAPVILRWNGSGYEQFLIGPDLNAIDGSVLPFGTVRALNGDGTVAVVNYNPDSFSTASVRVVLSADVPCSADLTTTGATLLGQVGFGTPDGAVDLDDLGYFLNLWLPSDLGADFTTTGATIEGQPGFGVPDGTVDLDDLGFFLNVWLAGCP
ncbi:MAG: GC-type dockerin domain-anchored protein [Planctomycetota bacterium]